jgi:asparagine synthase (glutamine-hydrolysing)
VGKRAILAHERLAIVSPSSGAQPLRSADGQLVLCVNGEIYNHLQLREQLVHDYPFRTGSDCEVILPLYERRSPKDFLNALNGIFAFVLYDDERGDFLVARDPLGVVPLYTGSDSQGNLYVSSELKALVGHCVSIEDFPPGCYLDSRTEYPVRYYTPAWRDYDSVADRPYEATRLRNALAGAVQRQLMADVPWGVLLSGGLDSSLVAALCARAHRQYGPQPERPVASFAIGLAGSPDLAAARKANQAIGTEHHEVTYAIEEGLDVLSEVIYYTETFDVTTIRASTPMYLLGRRIRSLGIKMVLSGEGADEVFGGYLYFHKAPNAREFHDETVRKLDQLYKFDCLRANKSLAAWGVETRVPFLDREFLEVAMQFDPSVKMCTKDHIEKWSLRNACSDLLPAEILWRQKEQFSDGVGYGWISALKAHAERAVSDADFSIASERFPVNTPQTKEAYLYRSLFEKHYPHADAVRCVPEGKSIACSTPTAIAWDAAFAAQADPSGRAVRGVHQHSY